MSAAVEVDGVTKRFGAVVAFEADSVNLAGAASRPRS
jgi:hypothetical protein